MIQAEVCIVYDASIIDRHWEIRTWCNNKIGPMALERDQVGDDYPWAYKRLFSHDIWYFSKEEYAVLFSLRWV